jgi:hypothetical protein
MTRTLAELTEMVPGIARKFRVNQGKIWELCATCTVAQCDLKAKACKARLYVNERQRGYYVANPDQKIRNRKENMTPEQIAAKRACDARYRDACKEAIKVTRGEYMADPKNREKVNAANRAWHKRRKAAQAGAST